MYISSYLSLYLKCIFLPISLFLSSHFFLSLTLLISLSSHLSLSLSLFSFFSILYLCRNFFSPSPSHLMNLLSLSPVRSKLIINEKKNFFKQICKFITFFLFFRKIWFWFKKEKVFKAATQSTYCHVLVSLLKTFFFLSYFTQIS